MSLNLSGAEPGELCARPTSCTRPQQLTLNEVTQKGGWSFHVTQKHNARDECERGGGDKKNTIFA